MLATASLPRSRRRRATPGRLAELPGWHLFHVLMVPGDCLTWLLACRACKATTTVPADADDVMLLHAGSCSTLAMLRDPGKPVLLRLGDELIGLQNESRERAA